MDADVEPVPCRDCGTPTYPNMGWCQPCDQARRCARIHAEHEQMGRALARMITDHPFVLDGDNGAMVASWFIHEAKQALGPAREPSNG